MSALLPCSCTAPGVCLAPNCNAAAAVLTCVSADVHTGEEGAALSLAGGFTAAAEVLLMHSMNAVVTCKVLSALSLPAWPYHHTHLLHTISTN
jgi:hypothetical protein